MTWYLFESICHLDKWTPYSSYKLRLFLSHSFKKLKKETWSLDECESWQHRRQRAWRVVPLPCSTKYLPAMFTSWTSAKKEEEKKPPPSDVLTKLAHIQNVGRNDIIAFTLGAAVATVAAGLRFRYLRRIPNADWVTPDIYLKKRWVKGIVTRYVCHISLVVSEMTVMKCWRCGQLSSIPYTRPRLVGTS